MWREEELERARAAEEARRDGREVMKRRDEMRERKRDGGV
jgi:hypothetical protein